MMAMAQRERDATSSQPAVRLTRTRSSPVTTLTYRPAGRCAACAPVRAGVVVYWRLVACGWLVYNNDTDTY